MAHVNANNLNPGTIYHIVDEFNPEGIDLQFVYLQNGQACFALGGTMCFDANNAQFSIPEAGPNNGPNNMDGGRRRSTRRNRRNRRSTRRNRRTRSCKH